jgi:uncharacterized membrane protein YdjX (TVP38/TMEM64 family)
LVGILLGLLLLAWSTGMLNELSDPDLIRARVAGAGAWGPLFFMGMAVALFTVFMLAPAIWAAAVLWPLPEAFLYSLIAALAGSIGTFALTRWLARDWARQRIPAGIQRWEARLEGRPMGSVLALRMLLWANPLVDMLVAVNGIPVRTYVIGTFVGLVPPTAFHIALGAGGAEAIDILPWWAWALIAFLLVGAFAGYRLVRAGNAEMAASGVPGADRDAA